MHEQQCQYQWKGGNEEKSVRSVGHLGLLLSDAIYGSLTNNALFLIPVNPGPFVPPPTGATSPQIDDAKDVWKDFNSTFQICHATEQALIAQVVSVIDPSY